MMTIRRAIRIWAGFDYNNNPAHSTRTACRSGRSPDWSADPWRRYDLAVRVFKEMNDE